MIYHYELLSGPMSGSIIEIEHSIKQSVLTEVEYEGVVCNVRRVISPNTNFILKGECWSKDHYGLK